MDFFSLLVWSILLPTSWYRWSCQQLTRPHPNPLDPPKWPHKMDRVLASFDATLVPQLLRFGFIYSLLDVFVNRIGVKHDWGRSMPWILLISSIVVALLGRVWLSFVTEYVPEPYLVGLAPHWESISMNKRIRQAKKIHRMRCSISLKPRGTAKELTLGMTRSPHHRDCKFMD